MSKVIRINQPTYDRFAQHAKPFEKPSELLERMLDHFEGVEPKENNTEGETMEKINRKQFMLSEGVETHNWFWSWSFANHQKKEIYFSTWKDFVSSTGYLLMKQSWERNGKGKRNNGYVQGLEHIRLIEEESYSLKVFIQVGSNAGNMTETAKIEYVEPTLIDCTLKVIGSDWYGGEI